MSTAVREHLRSNIVGYIALFCFATGGTAMSANYLAKNSVKSKHIVNGQVKEGDLADGSVVTVKLADGSVTTGKIEDGAVTGDKVDESTLGQVPDAAHADSADNAGTLDSLDSTDLQKRVTGTCASGEAVDTVNADGTVGCETVGTGDITGVTAGTGLTGGATSGNATLAVNTSQIQARIVGACNPGFSIRAIDASGALTCETDTDTTYAAGAGLTLTGTTFSVPTNGITTAMVNDNDLTGTDINESTLSGVTASDVACAGSCVTDTEVSDTITVGPGGGVNDAALTSNIARLNTIQSWNAAQTMLAAFTSNNDTNLGDGTADTATVTGRFRLVPWTTTVPTCTAGTEGMLIYNDVSNANTLQVCNGTAYVAL